MKLYEYINFGIGPSNQPQDFLQKGDFWQDDHTISMPASKANLVVGQGKPGYYKNKERVEVPSSYYEQNIYKPSAPNQQPQPQSPMGPLSPMMGGVHQSKPGITLQKGDFWQNDHTISMPASKASSVVGPGLPGYYRNKERVEVPSDYYQNNILNTSPAPGN